ncbi:PadR family transcriptional regulator [Mycobacterium sp. AZCC_0083]|uniref:PadR family transcriptional regulator n=1 Tax=Mycobacterium sp. AZCC_0083 TaxID=2735882 RepID=UPI0016146AD9|nr:PadR family transcriptional regulator [Mycobacterium sp. AZCC_0083]MBB5161319.1 DNA-binding PadR family transcriptional regulator [Mycobacterium sp. AZCC_0083]
MAPKRKVANLLALAVLATVIQRPMHRYEMASVMRARGKDRDMDIKWGSLYTVVQNLEKNGFVEPIEVTRQGARPERTVYQITEAGRRELVEWTSELIAEPETEHTRFVAGLSVMIVLAPDDAIASLRTRLARLSEQIDAQRAVAADVGAYVPRLFLIEDEYRIAMAVAEADWTRSLVDDLSSGAFPMLDVWRKWHESGAIPTELSELAQRGAEHE